MLIIKCPSANDQNVVAYDDTSFLGGNNWGQDIPYQSLPVGEDNIEKQMSHLSYYSIHGNTSSNSHDPSLSDNHMASIYENVVVGDKDIGDARRVSDGCVPHPISENKEKEKKTIVETANNAMEELTRLLNLNEPLWFRPTRDGSYILQRETYDTMYHKSSVLNGSSVRIESSKDDMIVNMAGAQLVDMFLDPVSTSITLTLNLDYLQQLHRTTHFRAFEIGSKKEKLKQVIYFLNEEAM